ncbi:FdtA/QdtA family cupin domain-containing protein [Aquimarina sp. 2201CG5-10]|uniref:sugar 3,4-ketoisomerase n=1 Tax=Aquimarina callyspongiae TaxID=3098150 RepID=UPI002AB5951D|nr:FdtA/QdtA family cupin domain-containing protein [Aquimarina sp. 2201CG5-10]MDY8138555.1 FdtA/QdtA family cupin domain-containing protein [Aquimarina sp. 2201CG5-10]
MASNTSSKIVNHPTKLSSCKIIEVPKIRDTRGNIAVIEKDVVPFETKRVYYLYDVPSDASRGGHAHKNLYQFLIAVSGSFEVVLRDGENQERITLNKPDKGLLIVPGIWRELDNFSSGSVCVVLASDIYKEEDYIRNFEDFELFKTS